MFPADSDFFFAAYYDGGAILDGAMDWMLEYGSLTKEDLAEEKDGKELHMVKLGDIFKEEEGAAPVSFESHGAEMTGYEVKGTGTHQSHECSVIRKPNLRHLTGDSGRLSRFCVFRVFRGGSNAFRA